jgi:hypothetical protein
MEIELDKGANDAAFLAARVEDMSVAGELATH